MTGVDEERVDDDLPTARWWLPIGALLVVFVLQGVAAAVLPPDSVSQLTLLGPLVAVGLALQLLSPLSVYLDSRYVRTVSEWEPSAVHYVMVLPPFAIVLAPLYLYQRHRYVGVP